MLTANYLSASTVIEKYSTKSNLGFEENLGQIKYPDGKPSPEVKYVFKQGNLKIFLLQTGLSYQFEKTTQTQLSESASAGSEGFFMDTTPKRLQTYRMNMELVGANPNPEIISEGKSEDYTNYYQSNLIQTHNYQKIIYKNIYPGIDWVIYLSPLRQSELAPRHSELDSESIRGSKRLLKQTQHESDRGLKYDFIIHPDADPSLIKLRYSHAEQIYLDKDGNLILRNRLGDIRENAPIAFQENDNIITKFLLKGSIISLEIKQYDRNQILIIDPKLEWSTYYGGSENDISQGSVLDKSNNIYLYGGTGSSSNIAYNGFQNNLISIGFGTNSGMIVKFNQYGQRLWASYYGINCGFIDAAIDNKNNIFLVGGINNTTQNFSQNGHQNNYGGAQDGLIVKLDSAGSRLWASYYGGNGNDGIRSCAIDDSNNIYFFGQSNSTQNIAQNGYQDTIFPVIVSGVLRQNNFFVKFNEQGSRQWGSYYGVGNQATGSIALDKHALYLNILHRGADTMLLYTSSYSIDTQNFAVSIAKFNLNGQRIYGRPTLQNYTFVSSTAKMKIYKGYLYPHIGTSYNASTLAAGFQPNQGGGGDMLIAKLDTTGNELWASYCGGNGHEIGLDICFDKHDNLYLAGRTLSNTGIHYRGIDTNLSGAFDGFVTKVSKGGQRIWSSYVGGNSWDLIYSVNSDKVDNIYLTGNSTSSSGISLNGFQNTNNGQYDAFLMKISCSHYDTIRDTICRGDTLLYRSKKYSQAGFYTDSLLTWDICDSFITLHLTVLRKDTTYLYDTICAGTNYVWNGVNRTTSGVYRDTLVNNVGCDSFLFLNLLVKRTDSVQVYDTLCNNLPKNFNGQNLTLAGVYRDTFMNAVGCDSHIFYHFIPKPVYETPLSRAICANDSSLFRGKYRKLAGVYYDTLKTIRNCDSVLKLTLIINPLDTNRQTQSICRGKSYNFYSQVLTSQGTYSHKFTNRNGCDSLILLTLALKDTSSYSLTRTICKNQFFSFNNQNLNTAGIYRDTLPNAAGCDSFITLTLLTNGTVSNTIEITRCNGDIYQGYTQSGTYLQKLTSHLGCDSLLTIQLTYLPATEYKTVSHSKCGAFIYGSRTYTQNDSFTETIKNSLNCDSIVTKHLVSITEPAPSFLADKTIDFCEEIMHRGQRKTNNFFTYDTIKSLEYPYCDSLYQPYYYRRESRPILSPITKQIDTVIKGETTNIQVSGAQNYRWSTGEQSPSIRPQINEDKTFEVTTWNLVDCEEKMQFSIYVIDQPLIDFPTAFSPNGDGLNDYFTPNTNGNITIDYFQIYNRWGEKVYEHSHLSKGWDGSYLGKPAANGLYTYTLRFSYLGRYFTKSGEVMMVR
jgi:gliding motility-associated-like protein